MSLRYRLRAPLISAVAAALIGGMLAIPQGAAQAKPKPDDRPSGKAAMLAREQKAAADGLTRSRAVFARSSYLCVGYAACAKAGMTAAGYASANDKMYWRMYAGHNCTNYAAYRMVKSGLPNQRPWTGGGNATYWGSKVPSLTSKTPSVGAVAWWKANTGPAGSAGHVAYVERVVSATEIVVSQDSWGGDFSWAVVTKASGNWPSGFVHFNDVKLANKAAPVVSGLAKVGGTLTASGGTWSPKDAKVSYQWLANGVAIPGATAASLALDGTRLGQAISVRTTASKLGYPAKAVNSVSTAPVLPGVLQSTAAPGVAGVAKVERTLSVRPGKWNVPPDFTTVQWYADGQPIAGATGATFKVAPEYAGRAITVKVTAFRVSYNPITVTTAAVGPVAPGTIKVRRTPALSGVVRPGQTLTVDPGAYHLADASVAIQWLRNGQPLPNTPAATYRLGAADLGARITAAVTVSRPGYQTIALAAPKTIRVRSVPRMTTVTAQRKHTVVLRFRVRAPLISTVPGTIQVRVQGGFRQTVTLHHGVARVVVKGLRPGRHALRVVFSGGPTVDRLVKVGTVRIR